MTKEKIVQRSISNFLDKEYKNYAMSVIEERAIPSVVDGFKPTARKVIHGSLAGDLKSGKLQKLLVLTGDTFKHSLYAHGDGSLAGVATGLAQEFNDNLPPLFGEGQFGSLRAPVAGSPRYLYIKHSDFMNMIYKVDYDLLDFVFEEGQYVEPKYYLPIIPTVLTKQNIGLAVGYSMHNISYNPIDIIDACLEVINSRENAKQKIKTSIRPYINGVKQSNWKYELTNDGNNHWVNYGEWKYNKSKDQMLITDLPYDVTYEDFEKLLCKLEEKETIKDWKNVSTDGNIEYVITFPKKYLDKKLKKGEDGLALPNMFKLIKQVPDDLLWLLDENHKLKYFNSCYEVVEYFVKFRLGKYTERKKRLVKVLEQRYKENCDLVKFIELICNGKLVIRNRSKKDIKVDMDNFKLPMSLVSTVPFSKCTIEERDELLKQNEEIKKELDYIKATTEKQMYINDLNNLKKELEKDFK
jgi:DNA topoisomerase-2